MVVVPKKGVAISLGGDTMPFVERCRKTSELFAIAKLLRNCD